MTKTADKIKETAAAETDPKALSAASKTEGPKSVTGIPDVVPDYEKRLSDLERILSSDRNGDGRVTLTEKVTTMAEEMSVLIERVNRLEAMLSSFDPTALGDIKQLVNNLEARLASFTA